MKNNKTCKNKKCPKVLPENYKYKYCEACRNRQAKNMKQALQAVGGVALSIGAIVAPILTKGKIKPKIK